MSTFQLITVKKIEKPQISKQNHIRNLEVKTYKKIRADNLQ
jgi:hypothetical protein